MRPFSEAVESFAYLWTTRRAEYILLSTAAGDEDRLRHSLPYNTKRHEALVIEDEAVSQSVKSRMHDAGVPIVMSADVPRPKDEVGELIGAMRREGRTTAEINAELKRRRTE